MFSMERSEQMNTEPSFISKAPYTPSGNRKQLVWPYIVSGRNVAATTYTFSRAPVREDSKPQKYYIAIANTSA